LLLQQSVPIAPDQTAANLFEVLAEAGAPLLVQTLAGLEDGSVRPQAQDHSQATLAPILTREDGRMDFSRTAPDLLNRWRGFQPWPGAFTEYEGKKLIIHRMQVADVGSFVLPAAAEPGSVHIEDHRLFAACAAGSWLELLEVQLEGKKRITVADFLRGATLAASARLGAPAQ